MQNFKQQLISTCHNLLTQKLKDLQAALHEVTEAGNNETKSTAGDKHETARAMMQLEQEKLSGQCQLADKDLAEFNKMDFKEVSKTVVLGSLVETDKGLFLIAGSIGKVILDSKTVFVISHKSPLGMILIGKVKGETFYFNSLNYLVKDIN